MQGGVAFLAAWRCKQGTHPDVVPALAEKHESVSQTISSTFVANCVLLTNI
jgi:hypothetical protein